MNFLKKLIKGVVNFFGDEERGREATVGPSVRNPYLRDRGPAKRKYLKARLLASPARTCMTKPMTPARVKRMREFLLQLRPDQRAVVYAAGWNKDVFVRRLPKECA